MDLEAETDYNKSVRVALIGGNSSSMMKFACLVISDAFWVLLVGRAHRQECIQKWHDQRCLVGGFGVAGWLRS